MKNAATVNIGDFFFTETNDDGTVAALPAAYRPFARPLPPDSCAHVTSLVHPAVDNPERDGGGFVLRHQAAPNWQLLECGNRLLFRTLFLEALTDRTMTQLDIYPRRAAAPNSTTFFSYPLAELITTALLLATDGLLLHACAVKVDNRVLLFCGESGRGKSTMARLWQQCGYPVLADDRVIVRCRDGAFIAMGTPWHGDAGLGAPLAGPPVSLYFLDHGATNRFTDIKGAMAVALILQSSFLPFWDHAGLDTLMDRGTDLLSALPCRQLTFQPDTRVIDLLLDLHGREAA